MIRDYYAVLDLEIDADYALIKQRYRQLVRENHPDIAADKEAAHARMQLILEAWKVLSDPSRRARYNNELAAYRGESKKDMAPTGTYTSNAAANTQPWESRSAPSGDRSRSSSQSRTPGYSAPRPSQNPRTKLLTMVFEAAQLYHREGRVAEAITVCNRVIKADPTNVDAVALLGDIYAAQNRKDIALTMYERAMRLQPNNALYRQKWNQLRHGDKPGSPPDFDRAPEAEKPQTAASTQTVHSVLFDSGPKRRGLSERLGGAEVTPPPLRRHTAGETTVPRSVTSTDAVAPTPDANTSPGAASSPDAAATSPTISTDSIPNSGPDTDTVPAYDDIEAAGNPVAAKEVATPAAVVATDASSSSFMDRFKARLKR